MFKAKKLVFSVINWTQCGLSGSNKYSLTFVDDIPYETQLFLTLEPFKWLKSKRESV